MVEVRLKKNKRNSIFPDSEKKRKSNMKKFKMYEEEDFSLDEVDTLVDQYEEDDEVNEYNTETIIEEDKDEFYLYTSGFKITERQKKINSVKSNNASKKKNPSDILKEIGSVLDEINTINENSNIDLDEYRKNLNIKSKNNEDNKQDIKKPTYKDRLEEIAKDYDPEKLGIKLAKEIRSTLKTFKGRGNKENFEIANRYSKNNLPKINTIYNKNIDGVSYIITASTKENLKKIHDHYRNKNIYLKHVYVQDYGYLRHEIMFISNAMDCEIHPSKLPDKIYKELLISGGKYNVIVVDKDTGTKIKMNTRDIDSMSIYETIENAIFNKRRVSPKKSYVKSHVAYILDGNTKMLKIDFIEKVTLIRDVDTELYLDVTNYLDRKNKEEGDPKNIINYTYKSQTTVPIRLSIFKKLDLRSRVIR